VSALEAPALWNVYPAADRGEVEALIAGVAERLHIHVPPLLGEPASQVALPPHPGRVVDALDAVRPDWRDAGLIYPPGPVAVPIRRD
jgi:hypothetical protein